MEKINILLVGFILGIIISMLLMQSTSVETKINITNISECKKYKFEEIASNLANNYTYKTVEKCKEISTELVRLLRKEGYKATRVSGRLLDCKYINWTIENYSEYKGYWTIPCSHSWVIVQVPIEATTGKVIPIEEYNKNYEYWYINKVDGEFW